MPYRLRLFSGDQLLVSTDHATTEGAGRQAAEFPMDDLMEEAPDGSSHANVRREVVFRDENGEERPATTEEDQAVFEALTKRMTERGDEEMPPCPRCGLKPPEHAEPLYPVRPTLDGPIYLACWTDEEREDLPPALRG